MIDQARIEFSHRQRKTRFGQALPQWQFGTLAYGRLIRHFHLLRYSLLRLAPSKHRRTHGRHQQTGRNRHSLKLHVHGTKPRSGPCVCEFLETKRKSILSTALEQRAELLLKLHDVRL